MPNARPTPDLTSYANWLRKERYQESTVLVTLRHIATAFQHPVRPPDHRVPHIKRYLRFVEVTKKNPLGPRFTERMCKLGFFAASGIEKHGKRTKPLLDLPAWASVKTKLKRGEPTSMLLVAYMQSGLRISEFLELRVSKVFDDAKLFPDAGMRAWLRDSLERLGPKQARAAFMYNILCDTERCAYARMLRKLQEVCEPLGHDLDLDTLYKSRQALLVESADEPNVRGERETSRQDSEAAE